MTSETTASGKTERYTPSAIEPKWQAHWASTGLYETPDDGDQPNFYFLTAFPYPSGDVHVGHWYAYAPADCAARFIRMHGRNVLFPMGFDAFGINAENAAIDRKMHPAAWTEKNMAQMREQFLAMGAAIDWRREVITCYPEYYRWNQWMFLKLLEKGLAYRATAPVNWCPRDETVLANEQVINGRCERCDTLVVKKDLTQWFYKITDYADELLRFDGLDWPERVRVMQQNWIGRSEGAEIQFPVEGHRDAAIRFFTTRPDTIYGATFMVLAPEHPLVAVITAPMQKAAVDAYVAKARSESEIERTSAERPKTGVDTGAFATNVFSGERIPIWIADYVLATYGTGAIMAVPAHDERDFAFATQYGLPIKEVVSADGASHATLGAPYTGPGTMVRSGPYSGTASEIGKRTIASEAKKTGIGEPSVTYRLRDWLVSRQRYWGTPIPIVYCPTDGTVPVPENQLPVVLPRDAQFTGRGGSPLAQLPSFVNTTCPKCGGPAKRETDTLDTFVDSSWYMYRYLDTRIDTAFMNAEIGKKWLPVDRYTIGIEHAILHLLYCRFVCKALRDLGYLWFDEPITHLRNQGTIVFKGRKMSKSRGNVQAPDEYVRRYGADTVRLFVMFMGPWTEGNDWDGAGIEGTSRFLHRVWSLGLSERAAPGPRDADLDRTVQRTIKKVTEDLEAYHFNTAIAAMMELSTAALHASGPSRDDATDALVVLLAPFAPHITEELWQRRGGAGSVHRQSWPAYDAAAARDETVTVVAQVDGKVRDRIELPAGTGEDALKQVALASPKVKQAIAGKSIARVIVVADRLV
ncbi:MAG TPA: leucine--tRNA ligase, partial [Candidatus Limnocylindria bacterium]|nr:leucine--tRNA ligase [Candidatus Limnocylindria bacterium]